jgi:phage N-6-adenine-methyltransferase
MKSKGIGGHEKTKGESDIWLTPPNIIKSLGQFDLDPCSPVNRPWDTAQEHYTIIDNGLNKDWENKRTWLNPPYSAIEIWMRKMSIHMNGISLVFARTETAWFQKFVFPFADSIFFFKNRIKFFSDQGIEALSGAGAPSVLISYGEQNVQAIEDSGLKGHHLFVNSQPVLIVGFSPTWKQVVKIAFSRLNEEAVLEDIYKMAEVIAPDKIEKNQHYQAKIRQTLQLHFSRISKGKYSNQQTLSL